jgi:DNA segregation ATPase FtsK/SpoIIIE-like protein
MQLSPLPCIVDEMADLMMVAGRISKARSNAWRK